MWDQQELDTLGHKEILVTLDLKVTRAMWDQQERDILDLKVCLAVPVALDTQDLRVWASPDHQVHMPQ